MLAISKRVCDSLRSNASDYDVAQTLRQVNVCKTFLDSTKPQNWQWTLISQVLFSIICVVIVGVLAVNHLSTVNLSGRVLSSEVQLRVSKPFSLNGPLAGSSVLLLNCDQVSGATINPEGGRISSLVVRGKSVKLEKLASE